MVSDRVREEKVSWALGCELSSFSSLPQYGSGHIWSFQLYLKLEEHCQGHTILGVEAFFIHGCNSSSSSSMLNPTENQDPAYI